MMTQMRAILHTDKDKITYDNINMKIWSIHLRIQVFVIIVLSFYAVLLDL